MLDAVLAHLEDPAVGEPQGGAQAIGVEGQLGFDTEGPGEFFVVLRAPDERLDALEGLS